MRLALLAAATGIVGWWLGRRGVVHRFVSDEAMQRGIADWLTDDPMDAVQPSDPWPPYQPYRLHNALPMGQLHDFGSDGCPCKPRTWGGDANVEPVSAEEWPDITPYFTRRTIGGMH